MENRLTEQEIEEIMDLKKIEDYEIFMASTCEFD